MFFSGTDQLIYRVYLFYLSEPKALLSAFAEHLIIKWY